MEKFELKYDEHKITWETKKEVDELNGTDEPIVDEDFAFDCHRDDQTQEQDHQSQKSQ